MSYPRWDDHVRHACGAGILGIATWGVACMALGLPLPKEHGQLVAAGVGMALYALFAMSAGEAETAETTKIGSVHEHATAEGGDAQTQPGTDHAD